MLKRFGCLVALSAWAFLFGLVLPPSDALAYHAVAGDDWNSYGGPSYSSYGNYENPYNRTGPSGGGSDSGSAAAEEEKPQAQPEALVYLVNPGDTLYRIAQSFGTSVAALQAYNHIPKPDSLQVGQKLGIPSVPADVPLIEGKEPIIQKVLSSTLTAYTAGKESTGKTASHPAYGITYSGVKAEEGRTVAVDPDVIPLGSTVYIEGIGLRKAEDTGSAIKGAKIDVFMDDLSQAQVFGVKKNVKVFVLTAA